VQHRHHLAHYWRRRFDAHFRDAYAEEIPRRQLADAANQVLAGDEGGDPGMLQRILDEVRIDDAFRVVDHSHAAKLALAANARKHQQFGEYPFIPDCARLGAQAPS
jgi:hypothetical protein